MQFATNVVAHLHRCGRCGRAGGKGRTLAFYNEAKEGRLVDIVRRAETEQRDGRGGNVDVDIDSVLENSAAADGNNNNSGTSTGRKTGGGMIDEAFSRRRGFRNKLKKEEKTKLNNLAPEIL